jgi:uncharacterized SAM-binding protein YcdF (DUF218 family)
MKETRLPLPFVGLIAGTRTALGVGIGLLVSRRLGEKARRRAGLTLVIAGALSTLPLALRIISGTRGAQAT